jgi:hypothetical protein
MIEFIRLVVLFDLLFLEVHELQEELLALLRQVSGFLLKHLIGIKNSRMLPLDQLISVTNLGKCLLNLLKPLLALVLLLDVLHQLPVYVDLCIVLLLDLLHASVHLLCQLLIDLGLFMQVFQQAGPVVQRIRSCFCGITLEVS